MGQILSASKPGLPATNYSDFDVFSRHGGRTRTAHAMEGGGAQVRQSQELRLWPTLDNAPISDVADAPLLNQWCDASGL